jgi:hypothetical protein
MHYIFFVIDQQSNTADSDEMAAIDVFNQGLQDNGQWVLAAGIAAPGLATLIDNRDDAALSSTGSLFDADDFYSGFWIVDAASDEEALTLASAGSKACNRRVEVRPFLR